MDVLIVSFWGESHSDYHLTQIQPDELHELYALLKEKFIPAAEEHIGDKIKRVECIILDNVRYISLENIKDGNIYKAPESNQG